jgi:hypothetical protein
MKELMPSVVVESRRIGEARGGWKSTALMAEIVHAEGRRVAGIEVERDRQTRVEDRKQRRDD